MLVQVLAVTPKYRVCTIKVDTRKKYSSSAYQVYIVYFIELRTRKYLSHIGRPILHGKIVLLLLLKRRYKYRIGDIIIVGCTVQATSTVYSILLTVCRSILTV